MPTYTDYFKAGKVGYQPTDLNFLSTYDAIKEDKDSTLVSPFGTERLIGILDAVDAKAETSNIEFYHYEKRRLMPKVTATTLGGLAGAEVTLTVGAGINESISYGQYNPYIGTGSKDTFTPNKGDVILILNGGVSHGDYVEAIVTASGVDDGLSSGEFNAIPVIATDAIPAIAAAEEIAIIGRVSGEGSGYPKSQDSGVDQIQGQLQTIKNEYQLTIEADAAMTWFEVNGKPMWSSKAEAEEYVKFLNYKELQLLVGQKLTNTTYADAQGDKPVSKTEGLIPAILSRGNTLNYGGASFGYDELEEAAKILDVQKGAVENMLWVGNDLNHLIDKEMRSEAGLVGGGINYGMFNWDEQKKIDFGFSSFKIGDFVFHKKKLPAFSDIQTLGAGGFGYRNEGMILPMDTSVNPTNGENVPVARLRYLAGNEMVVNYIDYDKLESGEGKKGFRYRSHCGLQTYALNRAIYLSANA